MTKAYTILNDRAVLTLSGPDRYTFMQGLITNDIEKVNGGKAIYAALLTPQGKYLFDFFIVEAGDILYVDCEKARAADLMRKLILYKLRSDVDIRDRTEELTVIALDQADKDIPLCFADPRHQKMGYRAIVETLPEGYTPQNPTDYDIKRLALGLPDGARDFVVDKMLILEGNLEALNGVSFSKGCYVGQELTARTKYRGNLRRKLVPVHIDGPLPEPGAPILNKAGREVGSLRSGRGDKAIAWMRLDALEFGTAYRCGDSHVIPQRPDWWRHLEEE
ncbi:YgfZ/GcvT domain-containing protein [Luteithermobacter gelatinilyticus]|uniref:CAF17-like 4Fe-4S cluster assembly/insertion protein YgfZ n=1 Tax=Luteithermobacter gelatinilyticus TaxID=2582913 RepID=UPI0011075631|nr:folate-binding protein YgfZ [Luteithermobacter gelatinilyticus]